MAFMLTPEAQAFTYDKGYFYPGPAVKNVPLSMAPKESQDALKEYGRPEYEKWLAEFPHTQSLEAEGAGRGVPDLGPAGRRAEDEVTRRRGHEGRAPSCPGSAAGCRSRRAPARRTPGPPLAAGVGSSGEATIPETCP